QVTLVQEVAGTGVFDGLRNHDIDQRVLTRLRAHGVDVVEQVFRDALLLRQEVDRVTEARPTVDQVIQRLTPLCEVHQPNFEREYARRVQIGRASCRERV